jgi:5-methylcytosine-specific restriction endonuclease McrA
MSFASISPKHRLEVTEKSQNCCAYCLSQQEISGIKFTIDHIIPESLGGETELENLCLACWDCNLYKQNRISAVDLETDEQVPLFHPNQQNWAEHFQWEANGLILVGKTATGRATVALLRLNRPILLRARERWIKVGWHPPKD